MHSTRALRFVTLLAAVALLGVVVVAPAQRARADAGAPRWSAGDFWVYLDTQSNATIRYDVVARESVTSLLNTVYDAWHVRQTTTTGSISVTIDMWIRDSDMGLVKISATVLGTLFITTYDPPQAQAAFPLSVNKQWSMGLSVSIKIGNGNPTTITTTYSAQVDAEVDVVVPAGTLHSFSVRSGTSGYTKMYYSDQVGSWSKQETYDSQDRKTGEQVLTSYRYQWNTTFIAIVGALVALAAVVVVAYLWKKRKKAVGMPGGPVPPPP